MLIPSLTTECSTSPSLPGRKLNDGAESPAIGLGTFGFVGPRGVDAILSGLDAGYRLLDTAAGYRNEAEVGAALGRSSVDRAEVRVTSKLRGPDHAYDSARRSIRESRQRLGGEPIDLYLIHWPNPRINLFVDAWRALVDARSAGDVVSIGVSNFEPDHLEAIIDATGVVPAVNQIELHPYFPQSEVRAIDASLGIITESWSPLGLGRRSLLAERPITEIAVTHHVTPAQVVLRWHVELGCIPIPRSSNLQRQLENLDIAGITLSSDEVHRISALGRANGRLWGGDPATEER